MTTFEGLNPAIDRLLCGHTDTITDICFHPSPQSLSNRKQNTSLEQIVTSSLDGTLRMWNYSNDREGVRAYKFLGHTGPCHSVRYSPSGSLVSSCSSDCTVRLWVPKVDGESVVLRGHSAPVKDADFSYCREDEQSFLLSCSDDKTLRLWDIQSEKFKRTLLGHSNWVNCCRFMPKSVSIAASGSDDGTLRVWDISKGSQLVTYNVNGIDSLKKRNGYINNTVQKLEFHPAGSMVAASLGNGSVEMYDIRTDHLVHQFHDGDANRSNAIAFHPNGHLFMAGNNDGGFSVWDIRFNNCLFTVADRSTHKSCCSWSSEGSKFVTAGGRNASIWASYGKETPESNHVSRKSSDPLKSIQSKDFDQSYHKTNKSCVVANSNSGMKALEAPHLPKILCGKEDDVIPIKNEISPFIRTTFYHILSRLDILTETVVLLEKRLSIQEEFTRKDLENTATTCIEK